MRVIVGILLCGLTLGGQTDSAAKGRKVVDDAIAALGGPGFLSLRNVVESGRAYSFYRDALTGLSYATIYTEYLDAKPKKGLAVREREAFGKKEDYAVLFLEDQAYDLTYRGARPIPDDHWKRYVNSTAANIFYILRERLNEPGMEFDYVGTDVLLNTQVNIVDILEPDDRTVRVYFDYNTKLPIRQEFSEWDPIGKQRIKEITDYSKYRSAGNGIQWPFVVHRERNGETIFEIFPDTVESNRTLPEKTFSLPPGVKILQRVD